MDKKKKAIRMLSKLSQDDLKEVIASFSQAVPSDYQNIEGILEKECPFCHAISYTKHGKTKSGLSRFQCKVCHKSYTILTNTPLSGSPYTWKVWVTVLEKMLLSYSIEEIQKTLIGSKIVPDINITTVSMMVQKLRNSFIELPVPTLSGIVQVDEKHFRESQKGNKTLIDPITGKRRRAHKRSTPSKYGTMGPEFATICCAVDDTGHSIAKVVKMGHMELEDFEDEVAIHFGKVDFLCSDMNPVYTQYASIYKIPQYVINSNYHRVLAKCETDKQKQLAYEQDKLDYVVGAGIMSYQDMLKFRNAHKLTINGVNGYHSNLERFINHIARGVSTKHLQAWVSFYNYKNNYRVDYGHNPTSYEDAERILIEILKLKHKITADDIHNKKDLTRRPTKRYTNKFIAKTVAARIKSNNKYIKFAEEDGIWIVDKRTSINLLPEYKRRMLAKELGIKPFSPIAVSSQDLKKQLLAHPNIEDALYVLANGRTKDEL